MQEPRVVHIGNLSLANNQKIKLIAGPCALESKEHAFEMAGALTELAKTFGIGLIYVKEQQLVIIVHLVKMFM